ncbi:MAG TPA: RodZ domain-containing protein [Trebonia sp.]|nr:RodZ domain-containing protein [Trebonia sp.]
MSIGDTLAEARRQSGLTITQVSQQTRIRESIVRAIEQGDFSPCGGDFYARGHIRSIAEVVGVDPVPLIREYDEEHGPPGGMRASQIFQPATPIRIREPRNLHLGRILAVALLAVIGFGAYHFVSDRNTHSTATPAATVRPAVTPTVTVTPTPAVHPTAAIPKDTAIIQLTAKSDCWIGFNSPTGQSLSQYLVKAGHTATWTEKSPVSMVIGNPPGVSLTVNGKRQQMNSVNVQTLKINPLSSSPVTAG